MFKWRRQSRSRRDQRGSTSLGEYALTIFLVVGVVVVMTTYVRRSLEGRMRDARHYMINAVSNVCSSDVNCMNATNLGGKNAIGEQYEPYYISVVGNQNLDSFKRKGLYVASSGKEEFDSYSNIETQGNSYSGQAPPRVSGTAADGVMM